MALERLDLIQLSTETKDYIVEPNLDLRSLRSLFADPKVTKIVHCVDNDARLYFKRHNLKLVNVFDTKIFLDVTGTPYPSFLTLCQTRLGLIVDKMCQRVFWNRR